jgi:hypothetical protein
VSIQSLLVGLVEADAKFVVVGGVAGGVHGSPFATNDLDVCYDARHANVARVVKVLKPWSVYPRGWDEELPFTLDARTFRDTPVLTLRTSHGVLDLLDRVQGVGTYDDALMSSEEFIAFGVRFRALTLDGLIRARRASSRPKDLAQIPTLEALADLKNSR